MFEVSFRTLDAFILEILTSKLLRNCSQYLNANLYGDTMLIMTMPLHIHDFHECVARKEHKLITSNQSFIKIWHINSHMVFAKSYGYTYVDLGITWTYFKK